MTLYIDRMKLEGEVFKKGKDESAEPKAPIAYTHRKPKGKTISGAAKMKAAYKVRKKTIAAGKAKKR